MRSVIVRLKGGLGNQLFQYATARAVALRNGIPLKLDATSGFRRDVYGRSFALTPFNINASFASPYESYANSFGRVRRYLAHWRDQSSELQLRYYVRERGDTFDPEMLHLECPRGVYLEGYWQSELYFEDVKEQVRSDLQIVAEHNHENLAIAEKIETSNAVAIHFRRLRTVRTISTSRVTPPDLVGDSYYKRSLQVVGENVKEPFFVVFSDDPTWARSNVELDYPFIVIGNNNADGMSHEDLWLMSKCKHHILANSTFSWWGAWLRTTDSGIVIAPEKIKFNRDIVPAGWIVL